MEVSSMRLRILSKFELHHSCYIEWHYFQQFLEGESHSFVFTGDSILAKVQRTIIKNVDKRSENLAYRHILRRQKIQFNISGWLEKSKIIAKSCRTTSVSARILPQQNTDSEFVERSSHTIERTSFPTRWGGSGTPCILYTLGRYAPLS